MTIDIPYQDPVVWAAAAAVAILLLVLVVWAVVRRRRRTAALRETFGPEYDRTLEEAVSRKQAEADLESRIERHRQLDIRPLSEEARRRYRESWREVQLRFVDAPTEAVGEAERLSRDAMAERGYAVEDFEERVAAISVDFPHLAERYRQAHQLSLDPDRDPLPTEELRQVMLDYRLLLEELLQAHAEPVERREAEQAPPTETDQEGRTDREGQSSESAPPD